MAQGILPYQYEVERSKASVTALAGLPVAMDMAVAAGLLTSIDRHVGARRRGEWHDAATVMSLVLLNLAGGDCVADLRVLAKDEGLSRLIREARVHDLPRQERRRRVGEQRKARRRGQEKAVPSPSSVFRYLEKFHDDEQESKREPGRAFIPEPNSHLLGLYRVNAELVARVQEHSPEQEATLDHDATIVESHKREALFTYKKNKGYQPQNLWWAEQEVVLHSEFRDGNVPAGFEGLRVLREGLEMLPPSVQKVRYRADGAGYEVDLLRYMAEGRHPRFGRIEFAVSADVTGAFRKAVSELDESDWQPLYRTDGDQRIKTEQEWAEVCYVPNWAGYSKNAPRYRFLAIREPMQATLPGLEDSQAAQAALPFPTHTFANGQRFKLFALVTNRLKLPGDELIWWHRARCGASEQVHDVMKNDLAGGQLPSEHFGANAAWWAIMILALNLLTLLKRVALPKEWQRRRLKALRFGLFALPGRVLSHARRLVLRLAQGHPALELLIAARQRILAWASQSTARAGPT